MSIDDKLVKQFADLYKGRTDAYGSVEGKCIKQPVTEANYRAHLEGKLSLGMYMLLDNGECHFAAVDLDEKVFDKALAIKKELASIGIHAYVSASRSKGYHVSMYAETKFVAKDIRRVLANVLAKLNMNPKTEIFPKQDILDKKTLMYGNYINLPCFGTFERPYLTDDQKELPLLTALSLIKRVPESVVLDAVKALPADSPVAPTTTGKPPTQKRGPKPKHPPCILMILMGVSQGGRDEAAFALARHYLDMQYTEDEVLALLAEWDKKNKPPENDPRWLETKLRSAQKGYAFGCSSVKNGVLSPCCVGDDHCTWLQENIKDKKKKGLLKDTTFFETPDYLFEELVKGTEAVFLAYNKTTGAITKQTQVEMSEVTWVPVMDQTITEGAVLLPDGIEEYGGTLDLVKAMREHINKYVDMEPQKLEFAAWYVLMTWVADKLRTVGYFRFEGDTGTGKSRALDVLGRLCYKPMMLSGAITPAPIYRLIRRFRGTLVLDEADFSDTSEKSEVITILNCGFEKGRPIVRCSKDDPNTLEILPCFGPKVFATRYKFDDVALEARCITTTMEETDRDDILSILDDTFFAEEMHLRNKLLLWRLHNYTKIEYNAIRDINLGKLEPRLKQTSLPYALMFKDMPEVLEAFRKFLQTCQEELISKRAESEQGKVVTALLRLASAHDKNSVTTGMIWEYCNENYKMDIKLARCSNIIHSLKLKTIRGRIEGKVKRCVEWDEKKMGKIYRRYILDTQDYKKLFEDKISGVEDVVDPDLDI